MSTRPLPTFQSADSLGPEHAGEVLVGCTACEFDHSAPNLLAGMDAYSDHLGTDHIAHAITSFQQAWEVVLDRVGSQGDLAECMALVNNHIRSTTAHVSVNADPVFGLRLLIDSCERMQSAAAEIQGEAEGLLSEMPQALDKTTAGV